jgi:site-specific DNA-methyltransferase (adenine-specific)
MVRDLLDLNFLMRGEIIWDKGASSSASTAWGSWQSASNPTLRDAHEYILVFSKGSYRRERIEGRRDTITKAEFLEFTKSVWAFAARSARKWAPRLSGGTALSADPAIHSREIVLDPFMGSGQTALAALKPGRHYVGYSQPRLRPCRRATHSRKV